MKKIGRPPSKFCPHGHDMSKTRVWQSGRTWCGACKRIRGSTYEHGISRVEISAMLENHGGLCAVCRKEWGKRGPMIDHDHATGRIRAILCHRCNLGLGHFNDNPELLRAAAAYIEKHRD